MQKKDYHYRYLKFLVKVTFELEENCFFGSLGIPLCFLKTLKVTGITSYPPIQVITNVIGHCKSTKLPKKECGSHLLFAYLEHHFSLLLDCWKPDSKS